ILKLLNCLSNVEMHLAPRDQNVETWPPASQKDLDKLVTEATDGMEISFPKSVMKALVSWLKRLKEEATDPGKSSIILSEDENEDTSTATTQAPSQTKHAGEHKLWECTMPITHSWKILNGFTYNLMYDYYEHPPFSFNNWNCRCKDYLEPRLNDIIKKGTINY